MASKLKKHTIICGSGTMAMAIINTLSRTQESLVVIDSDSKALSQINNRYPNVLTIEAKAVDEFALADANVLEAKCIVATLESDYDNLMISLTCKDLGTDIKIIARSNEMQVASRMMKLGVDDVICPFQLCGEHAAKLVCS